MIRVGVPLTEIIKTAIFGAGALEEIVERTAVLLDGPDEVGGAPGHLIDGEVDEAEMAGLELFGHEDSANFTPAGAADGAPQAAAKVGREG